MITQVMQALDEWVTKHGNGRYSEDYEPVGDFGDFSIPEIQGIQQVREEIEEFASLIFNEGLTHNIIEIGLGHYGSTHFLWRQLFKKVITVELSHDRIRAFGENTRTFYKKWVLDDQKSSFIIGSSYAPDAVRKVYGMLKGKPIDVLFIDGDHEYGAILADWLLYSPLVKKGGIVAFHDAVAVDNEHGVPLFLDKLAKGEIDGKQRKLKLISYAKTCGIAYYKKE